MNDRREAYAEAQEHASLAGVCECGVSFTDAEDLFRHECDWDRVAASDWEARESFAAECAGVLAYEPEDAVGF